MSAYHSKIRVMLIDDQSIIHTEIGTLLTLFEDIELVAQGSTGEEAIILCDQYRPDVVLMDIAMPVMNGIDATRIIVSRYPTIKVVAMTGMDDTPTVQKMMAAGAAGYVLKETRPDDLASIIRAAHAGSAVFSSEVVKSVLNPMRALESQHDFRLTRREIEILRYMVDGKTNREIAGALTISLATVKFHISNILRKLNVDSRAAAVALAAKRGLIH